MRVRELLLWTVVVLLAAVLLWLLYGRLSPALPDVNFSEFLSRVDAGGVESVVVTGDRVVATGRRGERFETTAPRSELGALTPRLMQHGVVVEMLPPSAHGTLMTLLMLYTSSVLPWFTFAIIIILVVRMRDLEKRVNALGGRDADRDDT